LLALQQPLHRFTKIGYKMKPIGNLDSLRRASRRTVSIVQCAIARDDLHSGMRLQPGRERLSRPIAKHLDGLVTFQIDEEGSVRLTFTNGKIVHTDDLWLRVFKHGHTASKAEEGARTDEHALASRRARTGFTALVKSDVLLFSAQAVGTACGGRDQRRETFGKDSTRTGCVATTEGRQPGKEEGSQHWVQSAQWL